MVYLIAYIIFLIAICSYIIYLVRDMIKENKQKLK